MACTNLLYLHNDNPEYLLPVQEVLACYTSRMARDGTLAWEAFDIMKDHFITLPSELFNVIRPAPIDRMLAGKDEAAAEALTNWRLSHWGTEEDASNLTPLDGDRPNDFIVLRFHSTRPPIALYEHMAYEQGFSIHALYLDEDADDEAFTGIWSHRKYPHGDVFDTIRDLPYDLSDAFDAIPKWSDDWTDNYEYVLQRLIHALERDWALDPPRISYEAA